MRTLLVTLLLALAGPTGAQAAAAVPLQTVNVVEQPSGPLTVGSTYHYVIEVTAAPGVEDDAYAGPIALTVASGAEVLGETVAGGELSNPDTSPLEQWSSVLTVAHDATATISFNVRVPQDPQVSRSPVVVYVEGFGFVAVNDLPVVAPSIKVTRVGSGDVFPGATIEAQVTLASDEGATGVPVSFPSADGLSIAGYGDGPGLATGAEWDPSDLQTGLPPDLSNGPVTLDVTLHVSSEQSDRSVTFTAAALGGGTDSFSVAVHRSPVVRLNVAPNPLIQGGQSGAVSITVFNSAPISAALTLAISIPAQLAVTGSSGPDPGTYDGGVWTLTLGRGDVGTLEFTVKAVGVGQALVSVSETSSLGISGATQVVPVVPMTGSPSLTFAAPTVPAFPGDTVVVPATLTNSGGADWDTSHSVDFSAESGLTIVGPLLGGDDQTTWTVDPLPGRTSSAPLNLQVMIAPNTAATKPRIIGSPDAGGATQKVPILVAPRPTLTIGDAPAGLVAGGDGTGTIEVGLSNTATIPTKELQVVSPFRRAWYSSARRPPQVPRSRPASGPSPSRPGPRRSSRWSSRRWRRPTRPSRPMSAPTESRRARVRSTWRRSLSSSRRRLRRRPCPRQRRRQHPSRRPHPSRPRFPRRGRRQLRRRRPPRPLRRPSRSATS